MEIWRELSDIPQSVQASVVTIGVFDGVHKGHRALVSRVVERAKSLTRERKSKVYAVALTFDPHPLAVHHPEKDIHLVDSLQDRLDRLEAMGIDAVFVQHYTLEFSQASAHDFLQKYAVDAFHALAVIVGEDARFGRGNEGDAAYLLRAGRQMGFDVEIVSHQRDADGQRWASSRVRSCLARGDVKEAAHVLGRPHRVRGEVVPGFQRGRELGFPTANVETREGEVPADGVYAGWLVRSVGENNRAAAYLPAAISVGTNPQFEGVERTVEAHVLGRSDLNLYGEYVAVDFIERIRPMMTFDSLEALLARMDEDLRETARILGVPTASRIDPGLVHALPSSLK